jgi:hypothetical protein
MNWDGDERRLVERVDLLEHEIKGNGKPGLRAEVNKINYAIYGDEQNKQKGMATKQIEIQDDLKELRADFNKIKPFLNPKLLLAMFSLSIFACLKVLGADLIGEVLKKLVI